MHTASRAPLNKALDMVSLLGLRRFARIVLVDTDAEFWRQFEFYTHRFDISTKELETAHERCDSRLVDKIHALIEPVIGPEGSSSEAWHHNLDWFGDGVRSLEVDASRFSPGLLQPLHALLTGEHEKFCILIKYYPSFAEEAPMFLGALAMFQPRIVMMSSLVPILEHV